MRKPARYVPHAIVFATSMGVMIVELVASRLVSKYLGSSLFTWTGVIGIVLGGISLGNWLGGRLADRRPPRPLASLLLLVSSLLTFLIIVLDIVVGRLTWMLGTDGMSVAALARTIALVAVLFFLPACSLGTVSPVMAKLALEQDGRVGTTVGGMYAFGSLGSIGGTFLAGFLLIPWLGLTMNILLVGALLAVLSLLLGGRRIVAGAWAVILVVMAATGAPDAAARTLSESPAGSDRRIVFEKDSPYSYIRVTDASADGGTERTLRLDALIHNKSDPARPDALLYEYERIFESLTRAREPAGGSFSTLTLGGGGFTMPSFLERHYPNARHTVVEIDPEVVRTAHRWFGLPEATRLRIVVADARAFVDAETGAYDLVYCDAFNAFSVPAHLTTREFTRQVARILAPGGMYLVNCIDIFDSGRFLGAFVNTMRSVFGSVAVYADPGMTDNRRATFVVAAGGREPAPATLRGPGGEAVGMLLGEEKLASLRARTGGLVLTDDHAPVDTLMAPVFLRSVH